MNKPKIKDLVIYSHPTIGDITISNIIDMLRFWLEYTNKYEDVSLSLLSKTIDEDTFNSLSDLLSAKMLIGIIDLLESHIE